MASHRAAGEAFREARNNRLRRAGWQRGEPFPEADSQGFLPPPDPVNQFSFEYSTEFF
jgi:hypothetical protein